MNEHDRIILRDLAKQYAEVCARPVHDERRALWRRHNCLKQTRPLIYVRAFAWKEMPQSACLCQDPWARQYEDFFRGHLFWDTFGDDSIFEPWVTVQATHVCNGWGMAGQRRFGDAPGGSFKVDYPLKQLGDIERLRMPWHAIDETQTSENVARLSDAIGDIVTITIEELDDTDQAVPDTRREDFTFTVGTDHNYYHIDAEITGMKKDETRIIEKVYPEDFEHEELKGETKRLRVTVTLIKERDVPDLDDEFAQDVSDEFETLDDLRKDLRKRLEANAERRVRSIVVDDLVKQILAESTIPVPESMVATELESSWRGMADQYRATPEQMEQLLAMQGKTKEDIFEDWKPAAAERLKRSLLVQKLIESEQVDVSDEEAESRIRAEAENRKSDPDQVLEYYKNNNMMSYVKREMAEDKLFDQLLEKNTVKAGKKQKYVDVMSDNG